MVLALSKQKSKRERYSMLFQSIFLALPIAFTVRGQKLLPRTVLREGEIAKQGDPSPALSLVVIYIVWGEVTLESWRDHIRNDDDDHATFTTAATTMTTTTTTVTTKTKRTTIRTRKNEETEDEENRSWKKRTKIPRMMMVVIREKNISDDVGGTYENEDNDENEDVTLGPDVPYEKGEVK